MIHEQMEIDGKQVNAYVIPCGTFNVVFATKDSGMIGCGAIDVAALDEFNYPAAKIANSEGAPIVTIEDLLNGVVKEANNTASQKGVAEGQGSREALEKL